MTWKGQEELPHVVEIAGIEAAAELARESLRQLLERRDDYMVALESASVGEDIRPFARFLAGLVRKDTGKSR